jgi:hypothetical protein
MGLKAKGRISFRIVGALLIYSGIFLAILLNFNFISNIIGAIVAILIILPWFLVLIFLKLGIEYFSKNHRIFVSLLVLYSILLFIIVLLWNLAIAIALGIYLLLTFLLLISSYFSLSIYKKKKIWFILSGISFVVGFFFLSLRTNSLINPFVILVVILVSAGMLIIMLIEYNLRKKNYLKYIKK